MDKTVVQARRAAEVVARLRRAIERPNTGTTTPVDVAQAARDVLQLLEPECRKRAVAVQLQGPASLLALGDPVALEQILHNLVNNALSALEQVEGRARVLTLTVEAVAPATVRLSVQDNGPGVPAVLAERLFEPFVSGRPGGLGLGLSLCETLAAEMGGHIRHTPAQPASFRRLHQCRRPRMSAAESLSPLIHLVDDDEAVRDALVQRGVDSSRITARGYGKAHPVADNASPDGRAMNRRVEIVIADDKGNLRGR
eukprot:gene42384-51766_t